MRRLAISERSFLLVLTTICLGLLGWIAIEAINHRVPSDSQTLIGVIVTGLLAFQKDIVQTIRAFWQDEKTADLTDKLASSTPEPRAAPAPVSAQEGAQDTADAAQAAADQISGVRS